MTIFLIVPNKISITNNPIEFTELSRQSFGFDAFSGKSIFKPMLSLEINSERRL